MDDVPKLTRKAKEESTFVIQFSLYDESNELATPNGDLTWTLTDLAEPTANVINSRANVALEATASGAVVLTGEDLSIGNYGIHRQLLLKCTYDSDLGEGLFLKSAVNFDILPFKAVT